MPLKSYQKATAYYSAPVAYTTDFFAPTPVTYNQLSPEINMWSLIAGTYRSLKILVASSSAAGLIIPAVFIVGGLGFIYMQLQPTIVQKVKQTTGYYDQGTAALVQDNYIANRLQYVSNPGSDYFNTLADAAQADLGVSEEVTAYDGTMYLTIPALGFNRLPIQANVESSTKSVYDQVLQNSLAHFKGTGLPISENPTNTVIYGHSASGAYNPRPDDVLAAFSFLSDLKIGDVVIIEVNGVEHKYQMRRSKIVAPDDVSILENTGKETLTLLTCYPPGNNTQRLIITAVPIT